MKTQQQLPIRTVVSKLEESIQKLTATISKQQTTIDALQEKVETCELKIDSLEKENVRLKSGNSTIESSENSDVATEATLERELSLILSPKTDNDKKANQQPTTSESEMKRERKRRFEELKASLSSTSSANATSSTLSSGKTTQSSSNIHKRSRKQGDDACVRRKALGDVSNKAVVGTKDSNSRVSKKSNSLRSIDMSGQRRTQQQSKRLSMSLSKQRSSSSVVQRKRERKRELEGLRILLRSTTTSEEAFLAITPTNQDDGKPECNEQNNNDAGKNENDHGFFPSRTKNQKFDIYTENWYAVSIHFGDFAILFNYTLENASMGKHKF